MRYPNPALPLGNLERRKQSQLPEFLLVTQNTHVKFMVFGCSDERSRFSNLSLTQPVLSLCIPPPALPLVSLMLKFLSRQSAPNSGLGETITGSKCRLFAAYSDEKIQCARVQTAISELYSTLTHSADTGPCFVSERG